MKKVAYLKLTNLNLLFFQCHGIHVVYILDAE